MHPAQFLRRKEAGEYLKNKYGFGSRQTLAKLAVIGGGPAYQKAGAAVLYTYESLDAWAAAKIGRIQTSTSDRVGAAA
jgi:hypothetical protein